MRATRGVVVPAGGGRHLDMNAPGRFAALKLVGHDTNESIMLFEETVPVRLERLPRRSSLRSSPSLAAR